MNITLMKYVAVIFLIASFAANAEQLEVNTLLMDKPNGKPIASLNKDAIVTCASLENGWYLIGRAVVFHQNTLVKDEPSLRERNVLFESQLREQTALLDAHGNKIGETLSVCLIDNVENYEGELLSGSLTGYVRKNSIKLSSIIENSLVALCTEKKGFLVLQDFNEHFTKYNYSEWFGKEPLKSYLYYENWMEDPSPGARIILIFRKNKLAALIHSRKLKLDYSSAKAPRGYQIIYFPCANDEIRENIETFYFPIIKAAD